MRKIILGLAATAAIAAPIAVAGSANASGAPVTQDSTVMVTTTDATVPLPDVNSQFTSMTVKVTAGNSYFGPNGDQITWYLPDGTFGSSDASGYWTSGHEYGNLRAEGVPAGAVVYSLDNGAHWAQFDGHGMTFTTPGTHVLLGYNDVPGLFGDNTGTGFVVNVHRVKG